MPITPTQLDDLLRGTSGSDTIDGFGGNDDVLGLGGNDFLAGGEGSDIVDGGAGNDTLRGGSGDDVLQGGEGDDSLDGGIGSDRLDGGMGNDGLEGGDGSDWLDGGAGDDSLHDSGTDGAGTTIFGGDGNDSLQVTSGNADLYGGAGNDSLSVQNAPVGTHSSLYGEAGDDTLVGGSGGDWLDGGVGSDSLDGGAGNDTLMGGAEGYFETGFDAKGTWYERYRPSPGNETLSGGGGDDDLYSGSGADRLFGGADADTLHAGAGSDTLSGGIGNDILYADAGNDTLSGGDGNDSLDGGTGADSLDGGAGNDILSGGDDEERWEEGYDQNGEWYERYYTIPFNESLSGGAGDDILYSGGGADRLDGGDGRDTLQGGAGVDMLTGGTGADEFAGSLLSLQGDRITDYEAGEKIHFHEALASASQVRLVASASGLDTELRIDGDNNGFFETTITLSGQVTGELFLSSQDGSTNNVIRILKPLGSAPVLGAIAAQTRAEDAGTWSFQVPAATDVDSASLTYSATLANGAALPSWLTFNASTRSFSGMPPKDYSGTLGLKVTVSDGALSASQSFSLVVSPVNDAPVLGAIAAQTRAEDAGAWSFQVPAATDVDSASLTYSASLANGTALPSWLTFNASTRTFSGTPPKDFTGTVGLRVTASDGALSAAQSFNLVVTAVNDAPTDLSLGTSSVREFAANGAVVGALSAQDVDSLSFTYELLNSAGGRFALSGGQVVVADGLGLDFEQSASHVIQVRVSDGQGGVWTENLTIGVTDITPEVIAGDARANTFVGGLGNDLLDGGAGSDSLSGGAGNDTYVVQTGDVVTEIAGGGTADLVRSTSSWTLGAELENLELAGTAHLTGMGNGLANRLIGNGGNNTLSGLDGNDTLLGGAGHDRLDGGTGTDRLEGGAGNDTFVLTAAGDIIVELAGGGTDQVQALASVTALASNVEDLVLTGTSALNGTGNGLANRLAGNGGSNTLSGLDANDILLGGAGHDWLDGGAGMDRLTGGLGNDVFVFASRAEAGDIITDFRNATGDNDLVQISASAFGGGLVAGARLSTAQFQTANDNVLQGTAERSVRFIWEKDATKLWFDSNGSGAGGLTLLVDLQDGAVLTVADILLV